MSDSAAATMEAVEVALAQPDADSEHVASAAEMARNEALDTLLRYFRGEHRNGDKVIDALDTLAAAFEHMVVPDEEGFVGEDEDYVTCDDGELEHARSLILRGEVDDCLHHLERALPEGYGVIAERLAHHFRSRP